MENNLDSKPFVFYTDKVKYWVEQKGGKKRYFVAGHISTSDPDLVNDIVTNNCMESMVSQFGMRQIKLDFEHETLVGKDDLSREASKTRLALGKACDIDKDDKGVWVKWELNSNWKKFDDKGKITYTFEEVWQNIEDGYYDAFSIAYIATKVAFLEKDETVYRLLDNVNLLNVALTANPVNPSATMTAVMAKSLEFLKKHNKGENMDLKSIEEKLTSFEAKSADVDTKLDALTVALKGITEKLGAKSEPKKGEGKKEGKSTEGKTEGKSEVIEIKSAIEGLVSSVSEMKGKVESIDKVLSTPQFKSLGSGDANAQANANQPEIKSQGMMDFC